jgi:carbon monoxide dehydrogenase subunit G
MRFEQEFSVDAPADAVWAFLTDVPRMAGCIPGASDVTAVDDATYDAVVTARIGPIAARFACRVAILSLDEAMRSGAVEVAGRDVKLGGGVKAKMRMGLEGDGPTAVRIVSDVDVLGKIGQYGHGMIAKRADAMLAEFAACVRDSLAAATS